MNVWKLDFGRVGSGKVESVLHHGEVKAPFKLKTIINKKIDCFLCFCPLAREWRDGNPWPDVGRRGGLTEDRLFFWTCILSHIFYISKPWPLAQPPKNTILDTQLTC